MMEVVEMKFKGIGRLKAKRKGGTGSGNFGHRGRPGLVGGSGEGGPGEVGGSDPESSAVWNQPPKGWKKVEEPIKGKKVATGWHRQHDNKGRQAHVAAAVSTRDRGAYILKIDKLRRGWQDKWTWIQVGFRQYDSLDDAIAEGDKYVRSGRSSIKF